MNIRANPIYISSDVHRWLRLLAKAETRSWKDPETKPPNVYTPDEIADAILRQAIREQHPQLSEHQKEIDNLEKKLVESLRNENPRQPV